MENHLEKRPHKTIFSEGLVGTLRQKAVDKIKLKLLPDEKIIKIILIGSSIKNNFGEYEPPGFRGSLFSDFDFIVFVDDDYEIPDWLDREPDGKPFLDDSLNLAYRNKNFIDNKYDVEVFFVKKSNMQNSEVQELGESAGIPMTSDSKHDYLVVYFRE